MNSFSEIARALHLKERYESITSEMPDFYPYKHLNFYTSGIVSSHIMAGTDFQRQLELGQIAREFRKIYNSVESARDRAFSIGE